MEGFVDMIEDGGFKKKILKEWTGSASKREYGKSPLCRNFY